jgi:hypothetical protein
MVDTLLVRLNSRDTAIDMCGFSFDYDSKDWIATERDDKTKLFHDDEVMALAIADQMAIHATRFSGITVEDGGF